MITTGVTIREIAEAINVMQGGSNLPAMVLIVEQDKDLIAEQLCSEIGSCQIVDLEEVSNGVVGKFIYSILPINNIMDITIQECADILKMIIDKAWKEKQLSETTIPLIIVNQEEARQLTTRINKVLLNKFTVLRVL